MNGPDRELSQSDKSLVGLARPFPREITVHGFGRKPAQRAFNRWTERDLKFRRPGEDGLQYIDNWSLWLDFKILLRTSWGVIAGTGS